MAGTRTAACLVLVTCPARHAPRIASALVKRRVAACVNVLPGIQSVFRWQGKVEEAAESLLLIKTTRRRYRALERAVRELHPYELPEVIALSIPRGFPPYLAWLAQAVSP